MPQDKQLIQLKMDVLAGGGDCLGRHEGVPVFVPFAVPGDIVLVEVGAVGQGRRRGTLLEVIEQGPHRVEPLCELFGRCGGCAWMNCSYEEQLRAKVDNALRSFRIAGVPMAELGGSDAEISIEPSVDLFNYRRRARLHWEKVANKTVLGFKKAGERHIVDLGNGRVCVVLKHSLRRAIEEIRRVIELEGAPPRGEVSVLLGGEERIHAAFLPPSSQKRGKSSFRFTGDALKTCKDLVSSGSWSGAAFWNWKKREFYFLGADSIFLEDSHDRKVLGSASCFAQANSEVNARIQEFVQELVEGCSGPILELYAGIGNFTLELLTADSTSDEPMIASEIDPIACDLLKRNALLWNGGDRLRIWRKDAEAAVETLSKKVAHGIERTPALVVMDPPRAGCRQLVEPIARLGPKRILYISCDSMTCARDVAGFVSAGYKITKRACFDTMPHTPHFELVLALER